MNRAETGVHFTVLPRRERGQDDLIVVGDEPQRMAAARDELGVGRSDWQIESDGGDSVEGPAAESVTRGHKSLGEFASTVRARDIDYAALVFKRADRDRFFGAVRICREHDVTAIVPRDRTELIFATDYVGEWKRIEFHPWAWPQRVVKRAFDIAFAIAGLVLLAPSLALISIAIKVDSSGPVLYSQERTGYLGETFQVRKFRTMYPESENPVPEDDRHNDRITTVGRVLRQTHLDELPQLWSILSGEMSTVGPRATWIAEEDLLEREVSEWQKRYFVKPGLTGLAQINCITSTRPQEKIRYDIKYIEDHSIGLDTWIVASQIAIVLGDFLELVEKQFD